MINIIINGEQKSLPAELSLTQLIHELDLSGKRIAVEVNQQLIPKSRHQQHRLQHGDVVEIVHAIGGG